MSESGASPYLTGGLRLFSIFSIVTGSANVLLGHKILIPAAERVLLAKPTLSILDNQVRFLGTTWAGYGTLLWWATNDLRTRQVPLALLGAIMFVAGIARLSSGLMLGWGAQNLKAATAIELVIPPLIYFFGF
ncbi:hypothetical protein NW768_001093 [Fusarium equiseti]|uniref:DUF4345 domain-containing protein n=1 Tax=Fusarium equiseti TaxID=61235 RepID=A0ABQ8RPV6_FUSEQ|nr:hypothetical protein NW768_001093 [Fusarium equiseti]